MAITMQVNGNPNTTTGATAFTAGAVLLYRPLFQADPPPSANQAPQTGLDLADEFGH